MSTITPLSFTGVSEYSDDFQAILGRAVAIASLPVQEIQNEQALLIAKKQALASLGGKIQDLSNAVKNLGTVSTGKALNVLSSNANRVNVTNNGATTPAVYTITDITSIAAAASETTASGFATADATLADPDGEVQLVIGGTTHTITLAPAENNLNGLRDAINALGAGVSASVLNTGSGATPYYLSLNANAPGETTLELRTTVDDAGTNILTAANQGSNAVFKLNGLDVVKTDNIVTDVIPGLSFTIVSTTAANESITLTLNSDRGTLATALSGLATAYNALRDETLQHIGENPGVLAGDFIVRLAQQKMRQLTNYEDPGATIQSLAALGIELDSDGKMSFQAVKFYTLSSTDFDAGFTFLGSTTTGFGALYTNFSSISDPVAGLIRTQQDQYDAADDRFETQVAEMTARIEYMQSGLMRQLQNADTLLAGFESQQNIIEASLQGLNLTLYGKKD